MQSANQQKLDVQASNMGGSSSSFLAGNVAVMFTNKNETVYICLHTKNHGSKLIVGWEQCQTKDTKDKTFGKIK
jgi:hypothetical protein